MKGRSRNQKERDHLNNNQNQKYENSRTSETSSPLAFAARFASDRTGVRYRCRADPRNARGGIWSVV
jgi:hypothetical protein